MIRREGDRLIIPLDERGRVVLTEEEWGRVLAEFRRVYHEQWVRSDVALRTALDSLVPEESNEQE